MVMSRRVSLVLVACGFVLAVGLGAVIGPSRLVAAAPPARVNVVVLCASCGISVPGEEQTPHFVLLDEDTGDVWAYRDLSQQPIGMGRLRLGFPIQK